MIARRVIKNKKIVLTPFESGKKKLIIKLKKRYK